MTDHGARLRQAREAAGYSLAHMAKLTHFSRSQLSNVERGCRKPSPALVVAYERALGDDMHRRTLITGVAASVIVPEVVSNLLDHGFASALGPQLSVDAWLDRVEGYGRDYMSIGADVLRDRLAADLIVLQQQLQARPLWAAAARTLTVYGKTIKGAREASRWYRRAAELADRSDDTATRVWTRGRSALALAYESAGLITARSLAEDALQIDDGPTLGAVNAHMALAHVYAQRGDIPASNRHLEAARRAFDVAGSAEQISDFAVPEWRFETFTSMLLSRQGDPRAVAAQDAADAARPSTLPRFATHIQLHRGLMLAKAGDVAGGIAYAQAALDALPLERHSLSLKLMLDEVKAVAV
jgi:transcriptional regulator with XRE-family HTH domain